MLDHVFTDAIGALRDALEFALLERQAFEERFHVDVLLGDMTWETSYGLPGEGMIVLVVLRCRCSATGRTVDQGFGGWDGRWSAGAPYDGPRSEPLGSQVGDSGGEYWSYSW